MCVSVCVRARVFVCSSCVCVRCVQRFESQPDFEKHEATGRTIYDKSDPKQFYKTQDAVRARRHLSPPLLRATMLLPSAWLSHLRRSLVS